MRGAFVDPGGDLPQLKAAAAQAGVTIEKILLTHGHIDHCGAPGSSPTSLACRSRGRTRTTSSGSPGSTRTGRSYGIAGTAVHARPLAGGRRHGHRRRADLRGPPLPRPHARPCRLPPSRNRSWRWSATSCSRARSAAADFPRGDQQQLIRSITRKLWPMGDDTAFVPATARCRPSATSARPIRLSETGC